MYLNRDFIYIYVRLPCFHRWNLWLGEGTEETAHRWQRPLEIWNMFLRDGVLWGGNTHRRSGSDTISINPVPALFKSMWDVRARGIKVDLAVSWFVHE